MFYFAHFAHFAKESESWTLSDTDGGWSGLGGMAGEGEVLPRERQVGALASVKMGWMRSSEQTGVK